MSDPISSITATPELRHPHEIWIIQPPRRRLWLHIVLLLATIFSTLVVGAGIQNNFAHGKPTFSFGGDSLSFFPIEWILQQPSNLWSGIPFSFTLMFILLAHEMGHYLYARRYRVYATLPYFVPFPSLIGTLGAFIRIKTPIPSRAALFDIGIAGPIAGFIPACLALVVGLSRSHPIVVLDAKAVELGFPLAFHAAACVLGISTPLVSLSLHPMAVAGWVGLFATALNLLPAGQLDGGHIIFSISPQFHRAVSLLTVVALIPMGKYRWAGWLLWSVLLALTLRHPPVPQQPPVNGTRRWVALFGALMFVMSFTPAPIGHSSGREAWSELRNDALDTLHGASDFGRHLLHRQ